MGVDHRHWYEQYGPMVHRRCRGLLKDDEEAREAMQDVFVEVLRRGDRLVVDAPSSFLYRTATNVCLNRLRTERRHPEDRDDALLLQLAAQGDDQPDGAGGPESRLSARALLGRLFAREQASTLTIAVLHYIDHLTLEEVASEVGLSVSGVRKRLRTLRGRVPALEGAVS